MSVNCSRITSAHECTVDKGCSYNVSRTPACQAAASCAVDSDCPAVNEACATVKPGEDGANATVIWGEGEVKYVDGVRITEADIEGVSGAYKACAPMPCGGSAARRCTEDGTYCSMSGGVGSCQVGTACRRNLDCPPGETCASGRCESGTRCPAGDSDCGPDEVCGSHGRCIDACSSDADCGGPLKCNRVSRTCYLPEGACMLDVQCGSANSGRSCVDNKCADTQCEAHADCPPGMVCTADKKCKTPGSTDDVAEECLVASDCGDPAKPHCTAGKCVECAKKSDCALNEACVMGACTSVGDENANKSALQKWWDSLGEDEQMYVGAGVAVVLALIIGLALSGSD